MSADDFQTKYSSVMESMLQSVIAETTKLFETMVDELKAEISRIKKENEDLKARCCQFESAGTRESEPSPGRSDRSGKRDTAVQCDIVPLHTILVEQCEPLRLSSLQNQRHHSYQDMVYALQEHDYETHGEGDSQMAFIVVKQEAVFKQEEVDSSVVCKQVLSDKADSPLASQCGNEDEGALINSVCSTRELTQLQRHEEDQMALDLPVFGTCNGLHGSHNQLSELRHSIVMSHAEVKDDSQGKHGDFMVSERDQLLVAQHQLEVEPFDKGQSSVVHQQCQSEGETSVNEESDVTLQYADVQSTQEQLAQLTTSNKGKACNDLPNGAGKVEATPQPNLVRRRRGQPPKEVKHPQQVEELLKSQSLVIRTKQEVAEYPKDSVEEVEVSCAVDTINTTASKAPQACPLQSEEPSSIATPSSRESTKTALEYMEINKISPLALALAAQHVSINMGRSPIQASSTAVPPSESSQAPSIQQKECCTTVSLQDAMLLVDAMYQSKAENEVSSQHKMAEPIQTQIVPSMDALQTVDAAPAEIQILPCHVETHKAVNSVPIKEQFTTAQATKEIVGAPSETTDVTPTTETQTPVLVVMPKQQHTVSVSNNARSSVPLSTQRSVKSGQLHSPHPVNFSVAHRPCKIVPQKIIIMPRPGSSLKPHTSASQSTTHVHTATPKVVAIQNNGAVQASTATGIPLGTSCSYPVYEETICLASSKSLPVVTESTSTSTELHSGPILHQIITAIVPRQESQTVILTTQQELNKSDALADVSSQELDTSVHAQTALDELPIIRSQEKDNVSDILESPMQPASISEVAYAHSKHFSSFNTVGLPNCKEKVSPVVTLTRLPFPVSKKESVLVSRLPTCAHCNCQSVLKPVTTLKKSSSVVTSIPSPAAVPSETCATLEELPNGGYLQPSTPPNMSQPVIEESAVAVNTTEPSAASGIVGDATSNLKEETSFTLQDCALPNERPIKERESDMLVNLTSMASKDTADLHLLTSESQFHAPLPVLSAPKDPEKASSDNSVEARAPCAETCTTERKSRHKKSPIAKLQCHIKTHMQATRTETNPHTEVLTENHKKVNDHPNCKNITSEPGEVQDYTHLKTADDPNPIFPRGSGVCQEVVEPINTASGSSRVSSRRSKATSESTPVRTRRFSLSRDGLGVRIRNSTMNPKRSISTKSAMPTKTKNVSVHQKISSTIRDERNTTTGGSHNNTRFTSLRRKRASLSQGAVRPKMAKFTAVTNQKSGLSKDCDSPEMSTNESTFFIHRKGAFSKDASTTEQFENESSSLSPRRSSRTTNSLTNTKSGTDSPSLLSKDNTSRKNAKKVASTAKPIVKVITPPLSKLHNKAKTNQSMVNHASGEATKKMLSVAVWTPPRMSVSDTPPTNEKRSAQVSVKQETSSPRSQNHPVVYPPSVSIHPIPVKAPAVVSPLQPLSVIGRRLLKNQCGECGCVLSSIAALESHVSLHTGQQPFSCTLCGKRFTDSKGLKRHGRVHRNGRIHVCQQCGKGFVYRFGLTKHLQMVHGRIKPFVCQICNKGCFTKLDVEAHIRIHTGEKPFHCNLCEKKFTRRVDLNVHLRWHNGEKRHWCPYCGKGFLDYNNLKRHKYIHTGEKPHSCPHCPKHFTQSGHLKKHIKNVHKIQ